MTYGGIFLFRRIQEPSFPPIKFVIRNTISSLLYPRYITPNRSSLVFLCLVLALLIFCLSPAGFISAVQVFSQSLLLSDRSDTVHSTAQNWLSLHLLGASGEHTTAELQKYLTLSLSLSLLQAFVVLVTMLRELYDDFKRYIRDREVNGQRYYRLKSRGAGV